MAFNMFMGFKTEKKEKPAIAWREYFKIMPGKKSTT